MEALQSPGTVDVVQFTIAGPAGVLPFEELYRTTEEIRENTTDPEYIGTVTYGEEAPQVINKGRTAAARNILDGTLALASSTEGDESALAATFESGPYVYRIDPETGAFSREGEGELLYGPVAERAWRLQVNTQLGLPLFLDEAEAETGGQEQRGGSKEVELSLRYDGGGGDYEIGRDILVSPNADLSDPLRSRGTSAVEPGYYIYTYNCAVETDTLYLRPPLLYKPMDITPVSVPLTAGATAVDAAGEDWFTLTSMAVSGGEGAAYEVKIKVECASDDPYVDIPRVPCLVLDGEDIGGGVSDLGFDQNNMWEDGTFRLTVFDTDGMEEEFPLDEVTLVVEDALVLTDPEITFSSEDVELVVVEE